MTPPPPGRSTNIFVTKHAIERYQQRIENIEAPEAIRRLRAIAEPHRKIGEGEYRIESRKSGPPVCAKIVVGNGEFSIVSVYPVTNAQIIRAAKNKNWNIH